MTAQVKVHDYRLKQLRLRVNASPVCDDSVAEVAYVQMGRYLSESFLFWTCQKTQNLLLAVKLQRKNRAIK